jgi:class 3 adenylate cyclase
MSVDEGGTVTRGFLFADLRGYTDFVERHGAAAAAALLTRYRELARAAIARFGGAEIKTEGDSFYVVFESVSSAVRCGLAINSGASRPADPRRRRRPRGRDGRGRRRLRGVAGQHRGAALRAGGRRRGSRQ